MLNTRSRLVALVATLVFCVQIFAPGFAFAQTAPEPPHTETFSTPPLPAPEMSIQSTNEAHAEFPPTGLTPSPMPDQGTISAEMVTVLSNAVTSAGHVVIDFGSLAGGVLDHGTNNFANTGTIFAISSNPEIKPLLFPLRTFSTRPAPPSPPSCRKAVYRAIQTSFPI